MRQITQDSVMAFVNGDNFRRDNTEVGRNTHDNGVVHFKLHGHIIALRVGNDLMIKGAGWQTTTTKERLNGILRAYHGDSRIYQKDFQWYLSRHGIVEDFPSDEWVKI